MANKHSRDQNRGLGGYGAVMRIFGDIDMVLAKSTVKTMGSVVLTTSGMRISRGFLNDLQDWELSLQEKDKMLKPQSHVGKEKKIGLVDANNESSRKVSAANYSKPSARQFEYSRSTEATSRINSFLTEESPPDATSEKELGNEFFKQKKYKEAIECYSRSIALSPTAVAYANRAMAFLKIKRYQEAEEDCTEALDLDDRYIKAYSRRATARKELGKLKASIEDSEFALRLEPQNQEIKRQYTEAKALYDKEMLGQVSKSMRNSTQEVKRVGVTEVQASSDKDMESRSLKAGTTSSRHESDDSLEGATLNSGAKSLKSDPKLRDQSLNKKQELKMSVQELAARAASRAMAEAAKNISPPKSAYQFEVSWRGISDDPALQAHFLKTISPATLPQLFKNALSAPILVDIVKCISTFFLDETELAVSFLDYLTKVSRFDMIIMCLSAADKADLRKRWEEVFSTGLASSAHAETLSRLRPKYCPGGWKSNGMEGFSGLISVM